MLITLDLMRHPVLAPTAHTVLAVQLPRLALPSGMYATPVPIVGGER